MEVTVRLGGETGMDLHSGKAAAGGKVFLDKLMNKVLPDKGLIIFRHSSVLLYFQIVIVYQEN